MTGDPGAGTDLVRARMDAIDAELSEPGVRDGVLYFNRLYRRVTERVQAAVREPGFFGDPSRLTALDVTFARLYFHAYDSVKSGQAPPRAWEVLFAARGDPHVLAIQFAVAGMNAHINHDLPLALLEQWTAEGVRPTRQDVVYADYMKVNMILKEEIAFAKTTLEPAELEDFDTSDIARLDDRIAMSLIDEARAHAWETADSLWAARHSDFAVRLTLSAVDRISSTLGRVLLAPLASIGEPAGPGATDGEIDVSDSAFELDAGGAWESFPANEMDMPSQLPDSIPDGRPGPDANDRSPASALPSAPGDAGGLPPPGEPAGVVSRLLEKAIVDGIVPYGTGVLSALAPEAPAVPQLPVERGLPVPSSSVPPRQSALSAHREYRSGGVRRIAFALGAGAVSLVILFELAKRVLGWLAVPGLGTPAGASDHSNGDLVDCTVFAPPSIAPGSSMLVQVFAHLAEQTEDARALATEFDSGTDRRVFKSLRDIVPRNAVLTFELQARKAVIDTPVQSLVWHGRAESVQFELALPSVSEPGTVIATVLVTRDGAPVGDVRFKLEVTPQPRQVEKRPAGEDAVRYRKAFISYADRDRDEVLKRIQMLTAVKVAYFQDLLNLEPGDRWWPRLEAAIDECDVFLLFWSSEAKQSLWVRKEVQHALRRQAGNDSAPPQIRPVILEGPPPVEPWEELEHLHVNDRVRYLMSTD